MCEVSVIFHNYFAQSLVVGIKVVHEGFSDGTQEYWSQNLMQIVHVRTIRPLWTTTILEAVPVAVHVVVSSSSSACPVVAQLPVHNTKC